MINNVTLVGRLTKDAKRTTTKSGITVATFTLAVDRPYTNANGQREADFIHCVIWRKPAENLAKFSSKGKLIGIEGRIQTRSYKDDNNQRVYVTEVLVRDFSLLEKKGTVQSNSADQQPISNTAPAQAPINGQQQQTSNTAPAQVPTNGQQQTENDELDFSNVFEDEEDLDEEELPF